MRTKLSQFRSRLLHLPKWARWSVLALIILLIAAGGFEIYQVNQAQVVAAATPTLQTAVARQGNLTLEASGTGTLIASSEVNIGFKTSGILTKLNVSVGDQVKAGDVLAQLDPIDALRHE